MSKFNSINKFNGKNPLICDSVKQGLATLSALCCKSVSKKRNSDTKRKNKCKKIKKKCKGDVEKCKCDKVIFITQDDINQASAINSNGYTITQPGEYKLCSDINWIVNTSTSYAITISGQNISIDLGGRTITQLNRLAATNFAIQIAGTAKYIYVHDGVLQDMSGGGIIVQAGASGVVIDEIQCDQCCYNGSPTLSGRNGVWTAAILINGGASNPVTDVIVSNSRFFDTGLIGSIPQFVNGSITGNTLTLLPTASVTGSITANTLTVTAVAFGKLFPGQEISGTGVLPGTIVEGYLSASGGTGTYNVTLAQTVASTTIITGPFEPIRTGFLVTGTGVTSNTTITGVTSPIVYSVSTNQNVASTVLTITDPNALFIPKGQISAILSSFGQNIVYQDLTILRCWGELQTFAINNFTSAPMFMSELIVNGLRTFGLCKGFFFRSCTDVLVQDFDVSNSIMYVTPTVTKTMGIGSEGMKINASQSITVLRGAFSKLYVISQTPFTLPTIAENHFGTLGITTSGFPRQIIVQDCTFQDFYNDGGQTIANNGAVNAAGFLSNVGSDIHFSRCTASNITASLGNAFGFAEEVFPSITATQLAYHDNTFVDCTVISVNITGNAVTAAGFRLLGTRDEVFGCFVDRVQDLRLNTSPGFPNAYGILLDLFTSPLQQANFCDIRSNRITNCDTAAIIDNTILKNSVISKNYASLNGVLGKVNYIGLAAWIPIRTWIIGSLPTVVDNNGIIDPELDNLNIRNP